MTRNGMCWSLLWKFKVVMNSVSKGKLMYP